MILPIAPLHRLTEKPRRRAILSDITCDSAGKIDKFVLGDGVSNTLPVHDLRDGEDKKGNPLLTQGFIRELRGIHKFTFAQLG